MHLEEGNQQVFTGIGENQQVLTVFDLATYVFIPSLFVGV